MFRIGQEYMRIELLDFVGSRQNQSGLIWGDKEPDCIIATSGGRHGERNGYNDNRNYDESWSYIGQGEEGDQNPNSFANSLLTKGDRTVLLFSTREPTYAEAKVRGNHRKFYKFEGYFEVGSWVFIIPLTGKRTGNKLIQYQLIPAENIFGESDEEPLSVVNEPESIYVLRKKIKQQEHKPKQGIQIDINEYRLRSLAVKEYALLRANGLCELCDKPAPFISASGVPFLEVHHIFSLSDDGPDMPENVAAICPNCHREAHYGIDRDQIRNKLAAIIASKEEKLTNQETSAPE